MSAGSVGQLKYSESWGMGAHFGIGSDCIALFENDNISRYQLSRFHLALSPVSENGCL